MKPPAHTRGTRTARCRSTADVASRRAPAALAALALALAGCAQRLPEPAADIPDALKPPPEQTLFLETDASGVQIYDCVAGATSSTAYLWKFRAPEATLSDLQGHASGRHFAGPTWEWEDASRVSATVRATAPSPDPSAIAWLLLEATSHSDAGVLARTRSVQRVRTQGGLPPAEPCTAQTAGQVARSAYRARYRFYTAAP